jgi:hypothetical protein
LPISKIGANICQLTSWVIATFKNKNIYRRNNNDEEQFHF